MCWISEQNIHYMNFEGADLTRPQEAAVLALIFPTSSTSLVLYKKSTSGYLGICKLWAVLQNRTKNENTIFQCFLYLSSSKAIMISLFKFNFRFFFKTKKISMKRGVTKSLEISILMYWVFQNLLTPNKVKYTYLC